MIILISGDFGVGKDTFANMLWRHLPIYSQIIKSYTTRKPRYDGEDTHIFISKDQWFDYIESSPDDLVAQTEIGGEYYGTFRNQFSNYNNFVDSVFDIYVVDDIGVRDVKKADIDEVFVIEIIRPKWLIDEPESRLNRERTDSYQFSADYRVINDGSLENLDAIAKDIATFLRKMVMPQVFQIE